MVTSVSIIACAVAVWSVLRARFGSVVFDWAQSLAWIEHFKPSTSLVRCCLFALVPALGAQILLLFLQMRLENVTSWADWMQRLPLPVYDHHAELHPAHQLFASLGFALGAVEAGLLGVVAVALERGVGGAERRTVTVVTALLAALAVTAPVMSATDPYEYVAAGMLGLNAYAPPHGIFDGTEYAAIYPHIRMTGVLYGPLWLLLDTATTHFVPTILAKLIVLRIVNVLLIVLLLALLARTRAPRAALVICAVNPVIWYYLVVDAHTEIEGLVAVVAAFLCAQRSKPFAATLLFVVAGLLKVPFLVAGAAAFAPFQSVWRRLALWAGGAGLVLAVSYVFPGGPSYVKGLSHQTAAYVADAHLDGTDGFIPTIGFVCMVMFAFLAFRRSAPGAAWLFGQLSPMVFPWYLLWGAPYALATRTLVVFLAPLPLLCAMRENNFMSTPIPAVAVVTVVCVVALDAYLTTRRRIVRLAHTP